VLTAVWQNGWFSFSMTEMCQIKILISLQYNN